MPYYKGDFYRGDFYRGDPFFGALLGPAIAGIGKLFHRGPKGPPPVRFAPGLPAAPAAAGMSLAKLSPALGALATRAGAMVAKHPVLSAAAAAGTIGLLGRAGHLAPTGMHPALMGGGGRGFHISRRTGATVRNRRMRVTNPKALHRAIRRAQGFARLAKKVLRFTSPAKAHRGHAYFKPRRRKKA